MVKIEIEEYGRLCREEERKKILSMIKKERDKGNVEGGGFSAGICLSNLMKYLKGE